MDSNMKREIILDNYSHPFNKNSEGTEDYIKVNSNNESCIDNIDLYIKFEDDILKDIKFDGEACAISTASTSIMIKNMIGKSTDEVLKYIENFEAMLNEEKYDETDFNEAIVFDETYKQGNRRTCVTLPYNGIRKAITKYRESIKDNQTTNGVKIMVNFIKEKIESLKKTKEEYREDLTSKKRKI